MKAWRNRAAAVVASTLIVGGALAASPSEQPQLSAATIAGIWHFDAPVCASSHGMGLFQDGKAWFDEPFHGTWQLDGNVLRFDVDEYDPGDEKPLQTGVIIEAEILSFAGDSLQLR